MSICIYPMRHFTILLVLLFAPNVFGCGNSYIPNTAGINRSRSLIEQLTTEDLRETWEDRVTRLRRVIQEGDRDYKTRNDLAVALLHTNSATEAIGLLEQIEQEVPGLYPTAANLGTAYELAGKNAQALRWIQEGIKRNSESHQRSEWLHVRILEAKIAMEKDPKWLESHRVLGISFRFPITGALPTGNYGETLTLEQIKSALIYQLHERLQFVKPTDLIVGNLLVDLGQLVSEESTTGPAGSSEIFSLALEYLCGKSTTALQLNTPLVVEATKGSERARRDLRKPSIGRPVIGTIVMTAIALLLIVVLIRVKRALWSSLFQPVLERTERKVPDERNDLS